jgi:hypothetical protein
VGIEDRHPRLSWRLASDVPGQVQTAYRVVVSESSDALESTSGSYWDTGKVSRSAQHVRYGGEPLSAGTTYFWKVMVWDQDGQGSSWSASAKFTTGLWDRDDWGGARWIGYEVFPDSLRLVPGLHGSDKDKLGHHGERLPVIPHFRAEFSLGEKPVEAVLHVSGLGHYKAAVNGQPAHTWNLVPGWTEYDKTVLYNSYDITDFLQQGANCVGFTVGNGFHYINRQRYWKLVISYGFPKLIYALHVTYQDGGKAVFVSDSHCMTSPSPITFSSIYGGEDYDARREQPGWDLAGFDDSTWKNALVVEPPGGRLIAEEGYPVKVQHNFPGVKIRDMGDGADLYDFGQNASGIIMLAGSASAGSFLRLIPGEVLDEGGDIIQCGAPYQFNYTFRGAGEESWQPFFTYYGFRYARVEYSGGGTRTLDLSMLHTRNSSPEVGTFACSDTLFNQIYDLIRWAMRSNMASVPTDCPHREKLGWLEQCYLVGPALHYNYDVYHLYRKLVGDMQDSQIENGLVPDIAPEYVEFEGGFRDSPEWGAASVMVPWYLYEWYGDMGVLAEAFPMMCNYVDYLRGKSEDCILDYGLGDWYDLGPKPPGYSQLTPRALTATAIFYEITRKTAIISDMLGKTPEGTQYRGLADSIHDAFNRRFFDADNSTYGTGSQTSLAMPLCFDLVPPDRREDVLETLVNNIQQNDFALTSGDIGYRFLVKILSETGHSEVLYKMNNRSDRPGYGYQLAKGATALTESWQALKRPSNNHMMLGHLMEWFYSGLAGIRQMDGTAGYRHVVIAPVPVEGMEWVKASYHSTQGIVQSEWEIAGDGLVMRVRIPVNAKATVQIPQRYSSQRVRVNGMHPHRAPGVRAFESGPKETFLVTGGGEYEIRIE